MTADFFAATHSPKVLITQEFGAQQLPFALRNPSVKNRMLCPTPQLIGKKYNGEIIFFGWDKMPFRQVLMEKGGCSRYLQQTAQGPKSARNILFAPGNRCKYLIGRRLHSLGLQLGLREHLPRGQVVILTKFD